MKATKNKSAHFRYIYGNGFGIQANGQEVTIYFGYKEDPNGKPEDTLLEVGVIAFLPTAKMLAISLKKMLDQIERSTGVIPVDEERIRALDEQLAVLNASPTV